MPWWEPARWTTSPYYALVVLVIACGGIPKGSFIRSSYHRTSYFLLLTVWLQIGDRTSRSCEIMQVIYTLLSSRPSRPQSFKFSFFFAFAYS